MPLEIYARQGDLVITRLTKMPAGGTVREGHVLAGSGTSSHVIKGKSLIVDKGGGAFAVSVDAPTTIEHDERHLSTPLDVGAYDIAPLRERNGTADQAVED